MRDRLIELLMNTPKLPITIGGRANGRTYQTAGNIADHLLANGVVVLHNRDIHDAFSNIIWYDALYCWLEELADALEKATGYYVNPLSTEKWHTEERFIWMLLVGMFGDWGTSIRGGWIEQTKECAEYIRWLCSKAKEGAE